jgi:hypothetical protein
MPGDLAPPKAGQKSLFSIAYRQHRKMSQKVLEHRSASIHQDSISPIKGNESWRSCPFHEVPPNRRQELFMQKIDHATSSLISMMRAAT